MKENTVAYWLNKLPEPARMKALRNARSEGTLDRKSTNVREALMCGFRWSNSPEKGVYWVRIFNIISADIS